METWSHMVNAAQSRGWSLKALAVELGMAYSTLCDLRRGETTQPRGNAAVKLIRLHESKALPPDGI